MDWKQLSFLEQLPLVNLIEQPTLVVTSDSPISVVIAQMSQLAQDYALVMAAERLRGIFTVRDGMHLFVQSPSLAQTLAQTQIGSVLVKPVITLSQSQASLWGLLSTFQTYNISQIPILDSTQRLLGVVTWQKVLGFILAQTSLDQSYGQILNDLLSERQRWELLLQGANDGIWDWDLKTNTIFYSQRWKTMLGYADNEISSDLQEWKSRIHPEDLDRVHGLMQAHCDRKTPFFMAEYRLRCKDGQYKWILDRGKALWDAAGVAIRMAGSQTDISDRKQAEQELENIFAVTPTMLCVAGLDGYFKRLNPAFIQVLGYGEATLKAEPLLNFVHPDDRAATLAEIERLSLGEPTIAFENRYRSQSGQYLWLLWNAIAHPAEGLIYAAAIDVTEQRQNQIRLEHQNRQSELLSEVTRKIRQSLDLDQILQTATTEVQHLLGCDRVFILKVGADGSGQPMAEAVSDPQFSLARISAAYFGSSCLSYYRHHPLSAIHDFTANGQELLVQASLTTLSAQSELSATILKQNHFWGILIAQHCHQPRQWNSLEQNLVQQLANQLGMAIDQATLFDDLEYLVDQRTQELTQINAQLQQEIAERQQITAALQESEQKLAGILNIAGEAIITIDQDQVIHLFNKEAERIFGYTAEEALGQSLDILIPKVFQKIHRQHVRDFEISKQDSRRMAERYSQVAGQRKDGTEFPAEASISKIQTKEGFLFTVMLRDVSQRYQSKQALQRSEAQLRLITNALPVLISYVDLDHRYRFNNYAYEIWLGIPYGQIENLHMKDLLGEKTYQEVLPYLEKALTGTPVSFETEFPHQDGNRHWVSISYIPDMEVNRVKGCFGLVSDISDRKAAEQVKDDFVSVVSHELRTPLTSVHGSLKLLATGQLGELTPQGQDLLNIALNNTERLTRLINDVLDLERIESGRVLMAKELCSAADLVQKATQAMQSMALEHQIQLQVEADAVLLWADPDHIEQTLTNLLSNAIKFSPSGEKVWLTATDQRDRVLFQVKDHGRGIPEKSLESIFERFKQVDASDARKHGGTGLGLAICREIIQRHGGRIWVTSVHGRGSTFCFTLPKTETAAT